MARKRHSIARRHAKQQLLHELRCGESADRADEKTDEHELPAAEHHHAHHIRATHAECHAYANLVSAPLHRVGHHAVNAHCGEQQSERAEHAEERRAEPRAPKRLGHELVHGAYVGERNPRIDRTNRLPQRRAVRRRLAHATDHERHRRIWELRQRPVNLHVCRLVGAPMVHVCCNADDLHALVRVPFI
jgi:hypothetical protein